MGRGHHRAQEEGPGLEGLVAARWDLMAREEMEDLGEVAEEVS